jgi:DNA-binding NarL/FixJ family response regulator
MERDKSTRKALRGALRRALLWRGTRLSDRQGELTPQFVKHLDAVLVAYSTSKKVNPRDLAIFNAKYDEGLSDYEIAELYHRKVKTIRNIHYRVLGQIIADNEAQLVEALFSFD